MSLLDSHRCPGCGRPAVVIDPYQGRPHKQEVTVYEDDGWWRLDCSHTDCAFPHSQGPDDPTVRYFLTTDFGGTGGPIGPGLGRLLVEAIESAAAHGSADREVRPQAPGDGFAPRLPTAEGPRFTHPIEVECPACEGAAYLETGEYPNASGVSREVPCAVCCGEGTLEARGAVEWSPDAAVLDLRQPQTVETGVVSVGLSPVEDPILEGMKEVVDTARKMTGKPAAEAFCALAESVRKGGKPTEYTSAPPPPSPEGVTWYLVRLNGDDGFTHLCVQGGRCLFVGEGTTDGWDVSWPLSAWRFSVNEGRSVHPVPAPEWAGEGE